MPVRDDQRPPERVPAHPHEETGYIQSIHSGPLPPPQHFMQYDQVLPGAADRILTMAENQGGHRQLLERRALTFDMIQQAMGTILAYLAFFISMIAAFVLLYLDKHIESLIALVTALGVAFGPKIYRDIDQHKQHKKEEQSNASA